MAVAAALVALAAGSATSGAVAAEPTRHPTPRGTSAVQEYFWGWSDTKQFGDRTFVHTNFPDPATMPALVIRVVPASPSRMVYLEFYQNGEWAAENIARTDAKGVAVLAVDPFCDNKTWCDGTYRYRIRLAGVAAPLKISYFEH